MHVIANSNRLQWVKGYQGSVSCFSMIFLLYKVSCGFITEYWILGRIWCITLNYLSLKFIRYMYILEILQFQSFSVSPQIIIIANFYTRFSHEAQSFYSVLLPWSLDTFQCRTYSAQFPLPREHSLPGIAAYNGTGKFKHNNLSPPTGSPFIHLGREQQCG